jgi:hypothetical protein
VSESPSAAERDVETIRVEQPQNRSRAGAR